MRLHRLIPCLLIPPLTAVLFLAYVYSDAFFALLTRLFGDVDSLSFLLVLFPLLVLILGVIPALLLRGKETRLWGIWTAVFYAVFFAVYVFAASRRDPELSPVLWFMTAPPVVFWHALPSLLVSAVRAMTRKRQPKSPPPAQ